MSNVVDLKTQDAVLEQASLWISRLDRQLTAVEERQLKEWLDQSPQHLAALTKLAGYWDEMESLSRLSYVIPHARQSVEPPSNYLRFGWVAASVISILLTTVLLLNEHGYVSISISPNEHFAEVSAIYETAVGGLSTISLPDGSTLVLNTNTRIEVTFSQADRLIRLDRGELHIDVAHDETRPLRVAASDRVFQAVGTQFNVRIDDSQRVELLVTEGKVKVGLHPKSIPGTISEDTSADEVKGGAVQDVVITQNKRLLLDADDSSLEELTPTDLAVELSWQNGNIIFRGEPLEEAIAEISRYTTIEFVIVDESLRKIRVAGLFKSGDVAGFLSSLRANFEVAYERDEEKTLIYSRKRVEGE